MPAKSRNSQFTASGDRRTTNDFKWLQPSQRTLRCSPVPARKNLLFAGDSYKIKTSSPMSYFQWTIIFSGIIEIILLLLVLFFFLRLKKSETLLAELQKKQREFIEKLSFNAQLEQELVASFEQRQKELLLLEKKLETRARELSKLVKEAEKFTRSPLFLKQIIIAGYRTGQSIKELARTTGLTKDEIELIVDSEK